MAIKEEATNQIVIQALGPVAFSADGTEVGSIIDTADFDNGIYFALAVEAYTTGTFTLVIEDGDDEELSDASVIPAAKLVYGTLPALTAATAEGAALAKEGIFGNKRYVRASVVGTDTSVGTVSVLAIVNPEIGATPQDSL